MSGNQVIKALVVTMIVQALASDGEGPSRLTRNRQYTVLGIETDWYPIVNDADEPCLYDPTGFVIVEQTGPDFWITEFGDDGERYAYPPEWQIAGYFEDWHDNVASVRESFTSVMKSRFK
jgi:hypothetical protein